MRWNAKPGLREPAPPWRRGRPGQSAMTHVFRAKLRPPSGWNLPGRPRLDQRLSSDARVVVLQAPAGTGKSVVIGQWLALLDQPCIYYGLDGEDRSEETFARHLLAGLREAWPDWEPEASEHARDLAAALAGEAGSRPPMVVALDQLEAAYGEPYLADVLAVLFRYSPAQVRLVLSTRAPLPAEPKVGADSGIVTLAASELALTTDEASVFLGPGDWDKCFRLTGGLPLALSLWRENPANWGPRLRQRLLASIPPHVPPDTGRALINEYLSGGLQLAEMAHHLSVASPGPDQRWGEVHEARVHFTTSLSEARRRADSIWDQAKGRGDRELMGAIALVQGDLDYVRGEFGEATEWYRQAFAADPQLETTGTHSLIFLLRDQGQVDEAERLARRTLAAFEGGGDLRALAYSNLQYGAVCLERGRLDEAESHFLEADRLGLKLAAEPVIGIYARIHRSLVEGLRGNAAGYRRLAQEAVTLAKGWGPCIEGISTHVLAGAMLAWGDGESAEKLLEKAYVMLRDVPALWHLHMLLTTRARVAWANGRLEAARGYFDEALGIASRQGYIQYLQTPRAQALPLILDALVRRVESGLCQDLLVRMGDRARQGLLELAAAEDPSARQAALYPLAALSASEGPASELRRAIERLLSDSDETVRDAALVAMRSACAGPAPLPRAEAGASPRIEASILGPMNVKIGGRPIQEWRMSKTRDLLAYFLLRGDRPATKDQVIEAIWGDGEPRAAQSIFHTGLYYLRRALAACGDQAIGFAGGVYRLDRSVVETDLDRFEHLAGQGGEAAWREAASLYRGDLLEGLDYPWCEGPRERARRTFLDVLRSLADHLVAAGRAGDAVDPLQLLVQTNPLDEDGHVRLIEIYASLGRRGTAIQQYLTLSRLLDEQLGVAPSARARDTYLHLLE